MLTIFWHHLKVQHPPITYQTSCQDMPSDATLNLRLMHCLNQYYWMPIVFAVVWMQNSVSVRGPTLAMTRWNVNSVSEHVLYQSQQHNLLTTLCSSLHFVLRCYVFLSIKRKTRCDSRIRVSDVNPIRSELWSDPCESVIGTSMYICAHACLRASKSVLGFLVNKPQNKLDMNLAPASPRLWIQWYIVDINVHCEMDI